MARTWILVAGLLASPAAGQTLQVAPGQFKISEGNYAIGVGIGSTAVQSRLQQQSPLPGNKMITSFALRRDAQSFGTYPAFVIIADIFMSRSKPAYGFQSPVFDDNHGTDKTKVADAQLYQFPETNPESIPYPWTYRFPLDVPFNAKGSKPLLWDILIYYRTNDQQMFFDACGNWDDNPPPVIWEGGTGCQLTSQSSPMTLHGTGTSAWPNQMMTYAYTGEFMPVSSNVTLAVGMDDKVFGPLALPYTLPGTETAASGACQIYNDFLLLFSVPTNANGKINLSFPAEVKTSQGGVSLFTQAIAMDLNANPYGVVLSNVVQHHLVKPFPSTIPISYSFSDGNLGPRGSVTSYQGLVVEFTY